MELLLPNKTTEILNPEIWSLNMTRIGLAKLPTGSLGVLFTGPKLVQTAHSGLITNTILLWLWSVNWTFNKLTLIWSLGEFDLNRHRIVLTQPVVELLDLRGESQLCEVSSMNEHVPVWHLDGVGPGVSVRNAHKASVAWWLWGIVRHRIHPE